ncbi:MAG: hypothetical protein ABI851_01255 [Saprospiraceae bacterium]
MNNLNKIKNLSLALLLIFFLTNCNPTYYIPSTQNIPNIHSKSQGNLSLAGSSGQYELLAAYGVSSALAVQLNARLIQPGDLDNGDGGSGKTLEAGLGYFKSINDQFVFDSYALLGFGTMENHFPSTLASNPNTTGEISANLLKIGIQPSISFIKKYFSITASTQVSNLNYNGISGSLIFDNTNQQDYLKGNNSQIFIEPALTIKAGLPNIKFQIQLLKSLNASNSSFKQNDALLSFGLNYNMMKRSN